MSALIVSEPGLFTTLQDLGRFGHQQLGMPVAGAIDALALRLANALVGNDEKTGVLEIGFMGPLLQVDAESVRIAVAGSVQAFKRGPDGGEQALATGRSWILRRGEALRIGFVSGLAYAYLAIEGGFAVAPFMGSVATYTRASLGGFAGRKLAAGDILPLAREAASGRGERAYTSTLPYGQGPMRVVLGPQDDYFTAGSLREFLAGEYTVTKEADRMGLRLEGPKLVHSKGADIASDGIATGCIQVPGNGQPIALLADHQTVGGYPKIATVISADLPRLGQMMPGQKLRFAALTVAQAEALRRQQEADFRRLLGGLHPPRPTGGIDLQALGEANLVDGMIDALSREP